MWKVVVEFEYPGVGRRRETIGEDYDTQAHAERAIKTLRKVYSSDVYAWSVKKAE